MGYLGIFQMAVAYILLTGAMAGLPVLEVSLLLLLEPVLNPIWTWLVHGENPGAWTLLGGSIIVLATASKAGLRRPRTDEIEGETGLALTLRFPLSYTPFATAERRGVGRRGERIGPP